jgi:hypothetical protein
MRGTIKLRNITWEFHCKSDMTETNRDINKNRTSTGQIVKIITIIRTESPTSALSPNIITVLYS